jgi:hypothetical protein
MAQKRTIRGEFRLRPDPEDVQVYLYSMGYFSEKYGVILHEFSVPSNHDHPLFTDPNALRPRFLQQTHSLSARAINSRHGDFDSLWSGQRHSAPVLLTPDDIRRKCIYVLLNPVAAGLVRYAWRWEGVTSWHMEYGKPIKIKKPSFFFSKDMPDEVELVIHRPKGLYPGLSDAEARRKLREEVRVHQGEIIASFREQGRTFMGMRRVLRQPRDSSPRKRLSLGGIRPHFASRSKWHRIEAARDLTQFWAEHEAARLAFEGGQYDVEFPPGTYLMKQRFHVNVRPP